MRASLKGVDSGFWKEVLYLVFGVSFYLHLFLILILNFPIKTACSNNFRITKAI